MDNTWYYTLSTIAQTLAAILGLAGIFVTIRLQNITEKLKEYKRRAYYIVKGINDHLKKDSGKITDRSASGLHNDLREVIENYSIKYEVNSGTKAHVESLSKAFEPNLQLGNMSFLRDTADNLRKLIRQRNEMIKSIKWPGIISLATIVYVILLLSTSNLYYDKCLATSLFIYAVILSISSISYTVIASWKLLKDSGEKI